jgi:small-conductance mechanosensitive channel
MSLSETFNIPGGMEDWMPALKITGIFGVAGLMLHVLVKWLGVRFTARTKTKIDDLILEAIGPYVTFWTILAGATLALGSSPLAPERANFFARTIGVVFLLTLSLAAAKAAAGVIKAYGGKMGLGLGEASISQTLAKSIVLLLGLLMALSQMGISIAPVLTALGVGSLAVALALQDTLANLFSGFHIVASRVVQVGDFVKLDTQQSGYVTDIGWRSCRIHDLSGNSIIVPNKNLASAIVYNYYHPDKKLAVLVNLGVDYHSDLAKVERVTCEVAAQTLKDTKGGVANFEPFIRYNKFDESSVGFTVIMQGQEFTDQYLITHEFIKRLLPRYRAEGIVIPKPQREVLLHETEGGKGGRKGAEPKPEGGEPRLLPQA